MDILKEYLIHSYLYYACDDPLIEDYVFDDLCKTIKATWDEIDSPFKEFVFEHEKGYVAGIKGLPLWKEDYPEEVIEEAADRITNARQLCKHGK